MTEAPARVDEAAWDLDAEIHSESVLLSVASDDGRHGVLTRLCRYPSAGTAWVWVHVATPQGVWSYADDRLPCDAAPLDVDTDSLTYPARPGIDGSWTRAGSRSAPTRASAQLTVPAHALISAPPGPGQVPVAVDIRFEGGHAGGGTLPGRSEVLGHAEATITAGGETVRFGGIAQWHEQEQSAPRFRVPFTYASLAGGELALVGLRGPRASGGFVRGEAGDQRLTAVDFGDAGEGRDGDGHTLRLVGEDGMVLEGFAHIVHAYELPLYGRSWRGTFVTAELGGRRVAGFVNRWRPDAPPFEPRGTDADSL